jgi:hypothetical protein
MHYFLDFSMWTPFYVLQLALTVWMLVDAHRRGAEFYWYLIIFCIQPFGAWAYLFLFKVKDFQGGPAWMTNLFQWRPSLQELRHRVHQSPTSANWLELADRLVELGAFDEALPYLEQVLAREPEHCRSLFLLSACHRGLGHPEESVPLLQKLITRQPNWSDYAAWRTLIEVCHEAGDLPGSLMRSRELARVAPRLEHRCLLAEQLLERGEKGEARKVVEQGLEDYRYTAGPSRRRDRGWVGKAKQLLKEVD